MLKIVLQKINPKTEDSNVVHATATQFRVYLSSVLQGLPSSFKSKPTILKVYYSIGTGQKQVSLNRV